MSTNGDKTAQLFVSLARVLLTLAFFALLGAWTTQLTGNAIFGLTQQHLYNDAIVLALLGIGLFLDAFWHSRNI